jgi:hypothetical protein
VLRLSHGRIVGGGVRNPLLGLPVTGELDIASPLSPERVLRAGQSAGFSAIPIKIDHGTVLLVRDGEKYEITTLRKDVVCDGRWAQVQYTRSWRSDATRRDFTINAVYMDQDGKLYDYVGGLRDIQDGVLRFVGDPAQRISEDYLRIVRMFRFWAHYTPPVDSDLQVAISARDGLAGISKERILDELLRLFRAQNPWKAAQCMFDNGVLLTQDPSIVERYESVGSQQLTPLTRLALTINTHGWPVSRTQKQWMIACHTPISTLEELLRVAHQNPHLASDLCTIYTPKLRSQLQDILQKPLPKFPLLPSELPVTPGPEMGRAYKAIKEWWVTQFPSPSRQACLDWWQAQQNKTSIR